MEQYGIELEIKGLSLAEVSNIVSTFFNVEENITDLSVPLKVLDKGKVTLIEALIPVSKLNTFLGEILIKYEDNSQGLFSNISDIGVEKSIIEIVFPPISLKETTILQKLFNELKEKGAIGTEGIHPISTHINLDVSELTIFQLRNLILFYKRKRCISNIPENRLRFISDYTYSFNKFLNNLTKNSTIEDMYYEYFYKQITTAPIDIENLYSSDYAFQLGSKIPTIIKYNFLKLSSYLITMLPDKNLSKIINSYNCIWPILAIEFRDFNTDFDLGTKVDLIHSLYEESKK